MESDRLIHGGGHPGDQSSVPAGTLLHSAQTGGVRRVFPGSCEEEERMEFTSGEENSAPPTSGKSGVAQERSR